MTDDLSARLAALPHRLRVAFLAECAGRVLRIYEVDYRADNRAPHAAVELGWRFACGGTVTQAAAATVLPAAADATPNIEDEGDDLTAAMLASVAAICALQAIAEVRSAL